MFSLLNLPLIILYGIIMFHKLNLSTGHKGMRRLHIGGRIHAPGWEVLDINPGQHVDHVGDARDLSRFENDTFEVVYSSHVLEHFDYVDQLQNVLQEWYRVLKPQGKLYVSVPDMDVLARLFLSEDLTAMDRFMVMRMMFGGHVDQHDYHYVGLNGEILSLYLYNTGFGEVFKVDNFGFFTDTSTMIFKGVTISLNVIAVK